MSYVKKDEAPIVYTANVFKQLPLERGFSKLSIINAYTQYFPGAQFDIHAFIICLKKINNLFTGLRIGLPKIGTGIGGGNVIEIYQAIQKYLSDCEVTIVEWNQT